MMLSKYGAHLLVVFTVLTMVGIALAQTPPMIASPAEQGRMKPLVAAETKAREAVLAKSATLPESAAVKAAKEAYDKAVKDFDTATRNLPEHAEWLKTNAAVVTTAFQIMADHKLSSLEYKPELNDKGELVFSKKVQ